MKKKIALMATSLVLVVAMAVGGTLAYLSATTDAVTNTFTVGNITATLTETFNTDSDGDGTNDKWVGKIVPGGKDDKDPTITIGSGSDKCYVYACIENTVKVGNDVVATPNVDPDKWDVVKSEANKTLYRYCEIVDASAAAFECDVFTEVAYAATVTEATDDTAAQGSIIVQGFAHQSENVAQSDADAAAESALM